MRQRIITGLIVAAGLLVVLYVRGWLATIVVAALMLGGMWEEFEAFKHAGHRPVRWPAMVLALLVIPGYYWKNFVVFAPLLVTGTLLVMMAICARKEPDWVDAGISLYPIYTIFLPLALLLLLFSEERQPFGTYLILLVCIIAMAGDVFAYFVGVLFGKHTLCPKVSPKKTVEGAIGGLVASVGCAVLYVVLMRSYADMAGVNWLGAAALGLIGGLAGQVGDLTASLVKRHCGIKDFGSIFPGHGGIMDRIDSLLFTLMVVCSYVLLAAA